MQHAPISKKGVDLDNFDQSAQLSGKKAANAGRKTNCEFKQRVKASEPLRRHYEGYNAGS